MKYIKLYENFDDDYFKNITFKKYGIEEVMPGSYRVWEFSEINPETIEKNNKLKNSILMKKLYYSQSSNDNDNDIELIKQQQQPFVIRKDVAAESLIYQSDNLQELLDHFDSIIIAKKYNL